MTYEQKLFFLLILLVIVPCILLATFALQALISQKVLIEQKIQESYKVVADSTHKRVLDQINTQENIVKNLLQQSPWIGEDFSVSLLTEPIKKTPFLQFAYILDKDYNIVHPQERPRLLVEERFLTVRNFSLFENAYHCEFEQQDFSAAIDEYQKIVSQGHDQSLGSMGYALIAIARCHLKGREIDKALDTYQHFSTLFGNSRDPQSLVFFIYAQTQIAELYKYRRDLVASSQTILDLLFFLIMNEGCLGEIEYSYHYRKTQERLEANMKDIALSEDERIRLVDRKASILQHKEQIERDENALLVGRRAIVPLLKVMTKPGGRNSGYLDYRIGGQQNLAYYRTIADSGGEPAGYVVYAVDLAYCAREIVLPILETQAADKNIFLSLLDEEKQTVLGEVPAEFFQVACQPLTPAFPFWSVGVYLKNVRSLDELSRYQGQIHIIGLLIVISMLLIGVYITIATFIREVQSARIKADFLSNVTHELKTPLTSIKLFTETLLMDRAMCEEERKECLQVVSSEAERLQRLIDRILDFAKMEQKKRTFHFALVDPGQFVRDAVLYFQKQIPEYEQVEIDVRIEPEIPRVWLDTEAMNEAILNLLSNASKYCDKTPKKIDVACCRRGEHSLSVSVKDNGIGIPKHEFERIFQNFYRIENQQTRYIPGSGLGLALVDSIVKAHRGKIKLRSKVNVGSEFTIVLDCHQLESFKPGAEHKADGELSEESNDGQSPGDRSE